MNSFQSVRHLLHAWQPEVPVYCVYPHVYCDSTQHFLRGFPGRVLYAVKANDEPAVVRLMHQAGVTDFDCASLPEIALVSENCPGATCYFMVPVRLRGTARIAQERYGVRHFVVDHPKGLELLAGEIDMKRSVVFARMAVHHRSAIYDLSSKFGAQPEEIPGLVKAIAALGAEPALAFNVGSSVRSPDAYRHALGVAAEVLAELPFRLRLVDIGGGYPRSYPGYVMPPLEDYFVAIREGIRALPLAEGGEILGEPGRALAAPGLSALVEVLLRKDDRLYINDGLYGIFWELRFEGHNRYPVRAYRNGQPLGGEERSFQLLGPTCDSTDSLPGAVDLPADIDTGDYLEFGHIGAYSLGGRTRFNGHFSDKIVSIEDWRELPPM
ncbi:MAG: type III PLP-dependent enzyme [Chloroflexi bacterium]|nr:type III PLP-dependent enzyme [Chloroflexota bacterium]